MMRNSRAIELLDKAMKADSVNARMGQEWVTRESALSAINRALTAGGVPVSYLRAIDEGTDNECLVVCNRIDPGAFPVFMRAKPPETLPPEKPSSYKDKD